MIDNSDSVYIKGSDLVYVKEYYAKEFDAYYHPNGTWEEPQCTDPSCHYCANRPKTAKEYIKV